jgi:nickel/cobalt transporter (NiCoT) family protein
LNYKTTSAAADRFAPMPAVARRPAFTRNEWWRLTGFYGFIALLHVAGWGLYLYYSADYPALVGLGFVAYMFGLRHAFDADHIAAVDDTVRYMLQKGQRPLGIGFFFSLGHSSVVLALAVAVVFAAEWLKRGLPMMQDAGSLIGASVSGTFLLVIAALNFVVLLEILRVWGMARRGAHSHDHLEDLLARRGFMNRLFGGRLARVMRHSWQMYPLGLLFGLGFDTASEIGLLAMTAGASAGNLPLAGVLCLPILFAAGMTAMDTTDGVLMVKAYDWAFVNPLRKIFYNITLTSLSVGVALVIGLVQLMQVAIRVLELDGPFFAFVAGLEFDVLGYVIAGVFLGGFVLSMALWKFGRMETRYDRDAHLHAHAHAHGDRTHVHRHFH